MKLLNGIIIVFVMTVLLCSCSNSENNNSDYVYYFGFDKGQKEDVVMYALMKKDSKESDKKDLHMEEYMGVNVNEVFEQFFEKYKDAYTGTVKEYAVGESMGEKGIEDLKVYIANSPKLPAKRKTNVYDSGAGFIYEKMEEKQQ